MSTIACRIASFDSMIIVPTDALMTLVADPDRSIPTCGTCWLKLTERSAVRQRGHCGGIERGNLGACVDILFGLWE